MRPYFQRGEITVYHADFREVGLPQADAVITDPPYGETSLKWDVWPHLWPQAAKALAPQLWCFGSMRMFFRRLAEFDGWKFAQELVWEKQSGTGCHVDRFRRVHEFAAHWYQGDWRPLGLKALREPSGLARAGRVASRSADVRHFNDSGKSVWRDDGTRQMRSVLRVNNCQGFAANEAQKPERIIEPLLRYSVPQGGLVIDCFAGSGTTLAVAQRLGFRAIGCEVRESQCEAIAKRLSSELPFSERA